MQKRRHFLRRRRWRFAFPQKYRKGDDFISRYRIRRFANMAVMVMGVALSVASFFMLRYSRKDIYDLAERVENLEYDRLCEAYKEAGIK